MIVVGREGMHTGVAYMHTQSQPNERRQTHTFPQHRAGAGTGRGRGYYKKGGLSKKLQAVKVEAVGT